MSMALLTTRFLLAPLLRSKLDTYVSEASGFGAKERRVAIGRHHLCLGSRVKQRFHHVHLLTSTTPERELASHVQSNSAKEQTTRGHGVDI